MATLMKRAEEAKMVAGKKAAPIDGNKKIVMSGSTLSKAQLAEVKPLIDKTHVGPFTKNV